MSQMKTAWDAMRDHIKGHVVKYSVDPLKECNYIDVFNSRRKYAWAPVSKVKLSGLHRRHAPSAF